MLSRPVRWVAGARSVSLNIISRRYAPVLHGTGLWFRLIRSGYSRQPGVRYDRRLDLACPTTGFPVHALRGSMRKTGGVPQAVLMRRLTGSWRLCIASAMWSNDVALFAPPLAAAPDERIVDVGCGPGFFCAELHQQVGPAGSVVGVDSSPAILAWPRGGARAGRTSSSMRRTRPRCRWQRQLRWRGVRPGP